MNILEWLQNWYFSQCDGDWEHQNGIKISTIDNPGWDLKINLYGTSLENLKIKYTLIEESDTNWYGYKAENFRFEAFGDTTKLETIILKFKEFVDLNNVE